MKVIKPNRLSALTRCFEHNGTNYLGVSVLAFMPFSGGTVDLLSEIALWKFAPERLGGLSLDDAMPKARGEFLVDASVHAPRGATSMIATATVGGVSKSLQVTGDRAWTSPRQKSQAGPLPTSMPIGWERTYGGPDFPDNPLGKGRATVEIEGVQAVPLPNVEPVGQSLTHREQVGTPISFGPLDVSWPQRQRFAGTYDQRWLETLFPAPAADLDWAFFNVAPRDQQREGPWLPGDAYEFHHMHPDEPLVAGRLPPLRARAFVNRRAPMTAADKHAAERERVDARDEHAGYERVVSGLALDEVPLAAQTLWFFPDAKRLVMVFTGSTPIRSDDGTDIEHLVIAAEHVEAPRPVDHYTEILARRLHPEHGTIASLDDEPLLPEGVRGRLDELDDPEGLTSHDNLLADALHRRAQVEHEAIVQRLRAEGVPQSMFPEPPKPPEPAPSLEELPELAQRLWADAKVREAEARAAAEAAKAQAEADLSAAGADPAVLSTPVGGPPTWTAEAARAELREAIAACRAHGADASNFEAMLSDERLQASWAEQERGLWTMYRQAAHLQPPAPRLDADPSQSLRAVVEDRIAAGQPLGDLDLTGADLSGMDLRAANLERALLESSNLEGADLSGLDLTDAVLAHACLRGASLDGSALLRTNLGKADLTRASMRDANLEETVLMGATLDAALLVGATMRDVQLMQLRLRDVDATGLDAAELTLLEAEVDGCSFSGAKLAKATLVEIDLRGNEFRGADLRDATLLRCELGGVDLTGADVSGARFVGACCLDGALLTEARMDRANLRGASLVEADLSTAQLQHADLSECVLTSSNLAGIRGESVRMDKADLRQASLTDAELIGASLLHADLRGTMLTNANLFGADLARVHVDEATRSQGATLTRARMHPQRADDEGAP